MHVPFRLVDVFAEAPFGGNQLCVVPEVPDALDDATMQALAMEIGFSETTYVTAVRPTGYDIRIFTPEVELPFAGHPTLGTAFTLAREGRIGAETVQRCAAGDIPVRIDLDGGHAVMRQLRRCRAARWTIARPSRRPPGSSGRLRRRLADRARVHRHPST